MSATVNITAISYDATTNLLSLAVDFSQVGTVNGDGVVVDAAGFPMLSLILLPPEAIGNRIAVNGYANGDAALTAIVLEHVGRVAPDATGTVVDWQSPSDEEKAAQLDALAGPIEAARVFFSSPS